jgi:hypothetical protein
VDYSAIATRAKTLIGKNGTKCVLVNPSREGQVYNPNPNQYEGGTPERFNGFCIISNFDDKLVDGTVIKAGDRQIVAVLEGAPVPGTSTLEVYDKTGKTLKDVYKVIHPSAVSPDAETIIVYRLHCRR